eukprot:scaffold2756_cov376-Prasinococcus_capsulatus_cf.AAC.4
MSITCQSSARPSTLELFESLDVDSSAVSGSVMKPGAPLAKAPVAPAVGRYLVLGSYLAASTREELTGEAQSDRSGNTTTKTWMGCRPRRT